MRPHSFIRTLAAAALIAVPSLAMAAPDQNTNPGNNNGCRGGTWVNGQCVYNNGQYNNGQYNNGQYNNNGRHRHHDGDNDRDDHRDNGRHNGWNNPHNPHSGYNDGAYNGNGYGNNGYGNGNLTGTISSFSPYNLYLSNGLHVTLHDGTIINPRGTNLTSGQRVRIIGYRNSDGTFSANEIDVIGNGYGGYRY